MNTIAAHLLGLEPFIQRVLIVGAAFFLLACANVFLTSIIRLINSRKAEAWAQSESKWRYLLIESLYGGSGEIPTLGSEIETQQFIKVWTEYHERLRGQATSALNEIARAANLSENAQKLLLRRSKMERLPAIVALGHLREPDVFDLISPGLYSKDALLSLISARALIQIDATKALPMVLPIMDQRGDWPQARIATMLHEAGPNPVSKYLPSYILDEGLKSSRLIQFLKYIQPQDQAPFVAEILKGAMDDIAKIECLPLLQFPEDVKYAQPFLTHSNPKFRKAAIELISRIGANQNVLSLKKMSSDPDLGVRLDVIRALAKVDERPETNDAITQLMINESSASRNTGIS